MLTFELNDRQKEILGLLNGCFQLCVPPEEVSTLQGSARIYEFARSIKMPILHDLGIAKRSLNKIGYRIMEASGRMPPRKPDFEDDFDVQFDLSGDLAEA